MTIGQNTDTKRINRKGDLSPKRSDAKLLRECEFLVQTFCRLHYLNGDIASLYMIQFRHLLRCKGRKGLVEMLKAYKLQVTQVFLEQSVSPIPFTKCDKNGICMFVHKLLSLMNNKSDIQQKRGIMSVMRIGELVTLQPEYNYSTITDPQSPESLAYVESILPSFREFLKNWKVLKKVPNLKCASFPLKNARGPNTSKVLPYGAAVLFYYDLFRVRSEPFYTSICRMLASFGVDLGQYTLERVGTKHSKIVSIADKFGKERIVAMGDIVSNWSVKPIEVAVQRCLSLLRESVAYKPQLIPSLIKGMGSCLYSADLSAFTDRFPRTLQVEVLRVRFGNQVAQDWETILTNRVFNSSTGNYQYKVGNPMGFLSSWSVSTLTHHAFIEYIAHMNGFSKMCFKYIMLGDDVLVSNEKLYRLYLQGIENLGLKVSRPKCTLSQNGFAEFAKRTFTPEGEITGMPVDLFLRGLKDPVQFIGLVKLLSERGYNFTEPSWDYTLLLRLGSRRVKSAMAFAMGLPSNLYCLPHEMWVGPRVFVMDQLHLEKMLLKLRTEEILSVSTAIKQLNRMRSSDGHTLVPETHPILTTVGENLMNMLTYPSEGFEVFEGWLDGETRVSLPSAAPQTSNVLLRDKRLNMNLALLSIKRKDVDYSLLPLTNWEIFQLCFPSDSE
jgi:hypothetical protein